MLLRLLLTSKRTVVTMRVIASSRQTGRTSQLIGLCAAAEKRGEVSYIVCDNHDEAYRINQVAEEIGCFIGFPLTYDEFLQHSYAGNNISHFFIDNAERLIQRMTIVNVAAIAVTTNDDE